jgi:hypothetical protein
MRQRVYDVPETVSTIGNSGKSSRAGKKLQNNAKVRPGNSLQAIYGCDSQVFGVNWEPMDASRSGPFGSSLFQTTMRCVLAQIGDKNTQKGVS